MKSLWRLNTVHQMEVKYCSSTASIPECIYMWCEEIEMHKGKTCQPLKVYSGLWAASLCDSNHVSSFSGYLMWLL